MMLRLHPQKKIYTRAKFEHAKDDVPPLKRDGTGSSSTTGLEELTAGEEESQTGTGSNSSFRGRSQHGGKDSETVSPGSSTFVLGGSGKTTERSGGVGGLAKGSHQAGISRRGGNDKEVAPRNQHEELEDFLTSIDDSDDSDADVKSERRRSYVQDSLTKSQSSSVDPKRSQLRVVVSRQSNDNLSGYGSKDACRSATTPISTNGTVGRQHGSQLTKAASRTATAMSGVDWNRNGSSSALSGGDVTPGVARTTTAIRPSRASIYGLGQGYGSTTFRDSTDEIEIETRFGPVRSNEYKGVNPGGLSLTGTPLSSSPSQARYAFGGSMRRRSATPEQSTVYGLSTPSPTRAGSAEPFSVFRSPATMQATSPSPVFFGHHHHYNQSGMGRRGSVVEDDKGSSSPTKKRPSIKKSTGLASPSSPHEMTRTLKSRHSSGSLSSLSSSSSSSSLASFYEGGDIQRSATPGAMTSFGLCQSGAGVGGGGARSSTSTWSYGLPDSPLRGECSGGESLAGSTTRSTTSRHCSKKDKSATTVGSGGREHKKRRKGYNQSTSTTLASGRYESPLQSKSEVILTRPMFGLGSSSNMSSFSLSLAASTESSSSKDVKGKHVDPKWSVEGSSSVSTPIVAPSTTTAFNVTMTPFQLPIPAYFSQGLGSKLDLEDALAGFPSSSSSIIADTSTTLSGKQPQRGGNSLRRTLRSSVSSPSLLTGHRDATSAIAAASGLPVRAQLASHNDLPPKSGTVDPSLISSSSSSSRSGSVSGQDATVLSQSLFDVSVSSAADASTVHSTVSGDERTARSRLLSTGSVGRFAHSTLDQGSDNRSNTPGVASYTGFQGTTPALVSTVSHFSETPSSPFAPSDTRYPSAPMSGFNVTRTSAEYQSTRIPSSSSGVTSATTTATTIRAAPLPLRPILSTSSHLHSHQQHPLSPYNLTPRPGIPFPTSSTSTTPIPTSSYSPALGGSGSNPQQYYTDPTSTFFTSPITSACTMTIPETGIRVLGPTITMITEDNRRLVLRRSAPLVLNEGVGEEKAARM